jgi:hypothetical protein
VIAQETGFSFSLPTTEGLFAFETEDDALAAMDVVVANYSRHSRAARQMRKSISMPTSSCRHCSNASACVDARFSDPFSTTS